MTELDKGSAIANKSWSSEQEVADADIEKELSNKEEDRKKDISDEISFYRQTKFSKTDAENITNKALGDGAFKRLDKHGAYKEISMLSPEIQDLWKKIENKRVEGKSQTSYARSLLKKEGVTAQEKMKLESDLDILDERDAAFEDVGDIILKEKNPREILKAIQDLSDASKIYQHEFQGQIKEQSDNIRARAGLQRLNAGINILSNFKNTISKIINNKEKNMTSKESSIIDPELEMNENKKDQLEGGGIEQEELPQEVAEKAELEIADVQNSTNTEVENNNANIEQKSGTIEDSVVRDQILADTQKSGSEVAQIIGSAVDADGKKIKKVINGQASKKNKNGGEAVFNGPRISAEDLGKLKELKNKSKSETEIKNPELQAKQEQIGRQLNLIENDLNIFKGGNKEEVDAVINRLAGDMKVKGDPKSDGAKGYMISGLEDRKKVLYRTKALLSQSKSPEEFYNKVNAELDQLLKIKNSELEQIRDEKDVNKKGKEERIINNKYNFRKDAFAGYLPEATKVNLKGGGREIKNDVAEIPTINEVEKLAEDLKIETKKYKYYNTEFKLKDEDTLRLRDEIKEDLIKTRRLHNEFKEYAQSYNENKPSMSEFLSEHKDDLEELGIKYDDDFKIIKDKLRQRDVQLDNLTQCASKRVNEKEGSFYADLIQSINQNKWAIWESFNNDIPYFKKRGKDEKIKEELRSIDMHKDTVKTLLKYLIEIKNSGLLSNEEIQQLEASDIFKDIESKELFKNPTELENDAVEASHKTNGPVYANESAPEDALNEAEIIKNGKKATKAAGETEKEEVKVEDKNTKLKTALEIELARATSMGQEEKSQEPAKNEAGKESAQPEATKEKTAEEILRDKNIEVYGGAEKLNQIFEEYKRLNELEDRGAYDNRHPLFSEWDALRVKIANINLEVIGKDRVINMYKIQNKDEKIREYFNTKLDEPFDKFKTDIEKESPAELAMRAATLIKYRNELKNCDWQEKDRYRNIPREKYVEIIKWLEQRIGMLNEKLPKKEGVSLEAALKDLSIDDFKKIEKEPEYKGGLPAVIEGEKPRTEMTVEQTARVESVLKEFNLTGEDAEKVEGFKNLSYGQRLLALENLRQLTLRDVRVGAVKNQKEEAGQAKGFWKKMWTGIKKKYDIAKHEKSISQNSNKEESLATLTQLARGIKEFKTNVVEKNGKLEFQYISGLENLTPEQAARVQKFNDVASELSRMPMEWTADDSKKGFIRQMMDKAGLGQSWSPDDPTRAQYGRCQELTAEFQILKQEVLQVVKQQKDNDLKKRGVEKFDDWETQSGATAQMLQIENLLRHNRSMNTNPDAEKVLMEIKSAPLWKRALNNIATEKGIYFAAGFALRSVSLTFLGTAGLIGAGAGMGGYMGYKRGKESLRENDALAQHKDYEETKKKRIEKYERAKQGKTEPVGGMEKTEKKIEDANILARNLEHFVEYIGKEEDPKRQMDLARRLRDRVKYVKTALDEGRINFGAADTRVTSLYELTDKLNNAVNCAEMYHPSTRHESDQWDEKNQSEVMKKLNKYLDESKIKLSAERRKYLVKQLAKGALYGAGFVTAGMMAREVFSHIDPHLFNQQGETDLGVRWISDKGGSGKPFIGGIVGKYIHGEPGSGGGGIPHSPDAPGGGGGHIPPHDGGVPAGGGGGSEKSFFGAFADDPSKNHDVLPWQKSTTYSPEIPIGQGSFAERFLRAVGMHEGSPTKPDLQKIIADYSEYFKNHREIFDPKINRFSNNSSTEFLSRLKSDLQHTGLNSDAAENIAKGFGIEMGKMGTGVYPEGEVLPGAETVGGSGGGGTADHITAASGTEKTAETLAGAKHEAAQFVDEIKNIGGIKHDSIWRSTHDLIRAHAKEMGMDYPGKGDTKLSEVEWYNLKASQLVNELDKSTPGGIKDLVHEIDKVIATKGLDGKFHIVLEESSGIKSGRLADLHHNVAGVKAPVVESAPSVPEAAPIQPETPRQPLSPYEDMLKNNSEGRIKEVQRLTDETIAERLDKIFDFDMDGWMGAGSGTYRTIKSEIADNFLKRSLPGEAGKLQQYLQELIEKNHTAPKMGETVETFIKRTVSGGIQEDINKLLNSSDGK